MPKRPLTAAEKSAYRDLSRAAAKLRRVQEEANTRKELLDACKAQHKAIDLLMAMLVECKPGFMPSKSGQPWKALLAGNAAIEKAESEQQ